MTTKEVKEYVRKEIAKMDTPIAINTIWHICTSTYNEEVFGINSINGRLVGIAWMVEDSDGVHGKVSIRG